MTETGMSDEPETVEPLVEPNVFSPTDLAFFGKPGVTLVPKKITSAYKRYAGGHPLWRGEIEIGCAGVEVVVSFDRRDAWEACYDWLHRCILTNQI
jgi:hypothetical protein